MTNKTIITQLDNFQPNCPPHATGLLGEGGVPQPRRRVGQEQRQRQDLVWQLGQYWHSLQDGQSGIVFNLILAHKLS